MTELNQASSTASDGWAARSAEKHLASVDGKRELRGPWVQPSNITKEEFHEIMHRVTEIYRT